jgi:hypothetical protein
MTRYIVLALALMVATPAVAEWDGSTPKRFYRVEDGRYVRADRPYREVVAWRPAVHRHVHRPPVRSWVARVEPVKVVAVQEHRDRGCYAPLSVVGDQAVTDAGAQDEAIKAWMQTARFAHGERYMDPINSEGQLFACTRSSIGSVAGQTFHRCEITAQPCKAPKIKADR